MTKFKIGDIVTQNENFYDYWFCPKFKRTIIEIFYLNNNLKNPLIRFDKPVESVSLVIPNKKQTIQTISYDYIKLDITEVRKEKLMKINDRI